MFEQEDWEERCGTLLSGHGLAIVLMNSLQLWSPAPDQVNMTNQCSNRRHLHASVAMKAGGRHLGSAWGVWKRIWGFQRKWGVIWECLRGIKGGGIDSREEWGGGVREMYDKDALFTYIKLPRNEENILLKIPALVLSHFFKILPMNIIQCTLLLLFPLHCTGL